jgi:hypothetical protein
MTNYDLLIQRLDAFIRKYYTNKLLKGVLLFLTAALAIVLLVSVGEYFLYFPSWLRYTILFVCSGAGLFALVNWIIVPLLQRQRLGKVISHEQAAAILGTHFPDVQDKLLNVLQLKQQHESAASRALIEASIEQKTQALHPIPFQQAVNLAKNRRYLPYLLPLAGVFIFLLYAAPSVFKESSERLLSPAKQFKPKAPFDFILSTRNLSIAQFDDLTIEMEVSGRTLPEQVMVVANGQTLAMQKKDKTHYQFTFYRVATATDFHFLAGGFESETHRIQVMPKPSIRSFSVRVDYPDYTGRKDEVLSNIGDIVAPEGTRLQWEFETEHTDAVLFQLGQGAAQAMPRKGNLFYTAYQFMRDTQYSLILQNKWMVPRDSLHYRVSVIPDQYPSLTVQQYNDSITDDYVLFVGEAGDDYGLRRVDWHYTITPVGGKGAPRRGQQGVTIPAMAMTAPFNYMVDIASLPMQPGEQLEYWFEACDNDAVHGSKCTRSGVFSYNKPTEKQLDSIVQKTQEQVNKDLQQANKQNDKIEKEVKQLQEKLLQKNELDWQDKKSLQEMMERNEAVQKQLENIQKKFEQNNKRSEQNDLSDDLKEKQENMEKLLDELKNERLNERMKKMEELMKMLNKDQVFDQLKQVEEDNALMEKDMDRLVEMMKQLERDMRLEEGAKKAKELAKKQEELRKETEQGKKSEEELKKDQDALNKEMEALKKEVEEIKKVNEGMENKANMENLEKKADAAKQNMQNSSQQLSQQQSKKASQSQQKAQQQLEEMAKEMEQMSAGGGGDQTEIDIKATRQLLQNLIRMSFGQEGLMDRVKNTSIADPRYVQHIQGQQKLNVDAGMIADSLFALSKRLPKLSSHVNKEIAGIRKNMDNAIQWLEQRNIPQAGVNQQYVMTGANNLALMLNEMLQQLLEQQAQQQNQSKSEQAGSCNKPGSKPSKKPGKGKGMQLSDIITQQQQLGNAMKQLADKMQGQSKEGKEGKESKDGKPGNKPGDKPGDKGDSKKEGQGKKPGDKGEGGEGEKPGGESEQMARIAAQQAALRKQLNDVQNQLRKEGKSNPNLTKIQQDMDRNETDLVNKRITQDLLRRQSEILTRLMETKEALREQEQGKERQANSGKEIPREIPAAWKEMLKNKQSAIDYYKTVPADLKPYYKQLVEQYYQSIR